MTDDAVLAILYVYEEYLSGHLDCYIIDPDESGGASEIRGVEPQPQRILSFNLAVVSESECGLYVTEDDYETMSEEIRVRSPQEVLEVLRHTTNWTKDPDWKARFDRS